MKLKTVAQSLFFTLLGLSLFYYTFQDLSLSVLIDYLGSARWRFVLVAIFVHLANHLLRAYRWALFLGGQGYPTAVGKTFLAEMTGFFSNVFFPRLGEWSRCNALKRMQGIPMSKSLGGVVVERVVDILFFGLLLLGFLVSRGHSPLALFPQGPAPAEEVASLRFFSPTTLTLVGLLLLAGSALYQQSPQEPGGWKAMVGRFLRELLEGIVETRRVGKRFVVLTTLGIWGLYFLVEYLSLCALEATSGLDLRAAFFLFIVLNLSMAIPVPGNIGTYHFMMTQALLALGVAKESAQAYTMIMHFLQLFNAVVVGGICQLRVLYITSDRSTPVGKAGGG